MMLFFGILLSGVIYLASCGTGGGTKEPPIEQPIIENEDDSFGEFYTRFHRDSAYQMEHITFPLEGLPMMADSFLVNYGKHFYEKDGWKILKEVDWDTIEGYVRTLEPTGLGIVNEYICTHDNFCMSRRFAKLHDGWYLVYYEDMNYRGAK